MSDEIDDLRKRIHEASRNIAAQVAPRVADMDFMKNLNRSVAGELFNQMKLDIPTQEERFDFASTASLISAMAQEIEALKAERPDNMLLVLTMHTPDGRIMLVEEVAPIGFSAFRARGYVGELRCTVLGHISSLNMFCSYEERRGQREVGFKFEVPTIQPAEEPIAATAPAQESQPKQRGRKKARP